ncbi:DUF3592 domain-containing protein [Streptomyces syringium]|uniref:DUF3592 domain-containing protein n=1 Tax=Streptomyces syringium TaxID=76729 RepID=UPI0036C6707C
MCNLVRPVIFLGGDWRGMMSFNSFGLVEWGASSVVVIWLVGIGLLCPVPFVVAFVVAPWRQGRRLKRVGVRVPGICTRISWDEGASISTINYVTLDGRKLVHRTAHNYSKPIEPGEEVEIAYDPGRPTRARIARWLDGEPGHRFINRSVLAVEAIFLIPQIIWLYVILYNLI